MTGRRIGILTFHRCINHGSYWQARCLVDGLRARGHDAEIIDHTSPRVTLAEWRCALSPTLPTPVPRGDRPLYRDKVRGFFDAISTLPMSPPFVLERDVPGTTYETVVVGSDEVWNLCHPWYGGYVVFYGHGVRTERLVSYAASFGSYDAAWGLGDPWAQLLRGFSAISVRDANSRAIVAAAVGEEPELVLDPCLQYAPTTRAPWRGPDEPFVVVYGHNFSESFTRHVRLWAASRGCRLVSISYRNDWADVQWIDAGPHDFAHAIARARAVATNFFHGCVFALRNQRPFVCESTGYRSHKVRSLMTTLGAEEHLMSDDTPAEAYAERLDGPIAADVLSRLDVLRRTSDEYLDRALA